MIRTEELSPLSPTPAEIALGVLGVVLVLHVVLIVVFMVLVVLDRARVPRGGIWVAILLLVPALGPVVVLLRGRRTGPDTSGE